MWKKNNKLYNFCWRKARLSKRGPREATTKAGFLTHLPGCFTWVPICFGRGLGEQKTQLDRCPPGLGFGTIGVKCWK